MPSRAETAASPTAPVLGTSIPHDSAVGHVTGRAVYLGDVAPAANELFVDFVGSPVAHGRVIGVDTGGPRAFPESSRSSPPRTSPVTTRSGPSFMTKNCSRRNSFIISDSPSS